MISKQKQIERARERLMGGETKRTNPKPQRPKVSGKAYPKKAKKAHGQYKKDLKAWKVKTGVSQWYEQRVTETGPRGGERLKIKETQQRQQEVFDQQLADGVARQPSRDIKGGGGELIKKPHDPTGASDLNHRGPAFKRRSRAKKRNTLRIQR